MATELPLATLNALEAKGKANQNQLLGLAAPSIGRTSTRYAALPPGYVKQSPPRETIGYFIEPLPDHLCEYAPPDTDYREGPINNEDSRFRRILVDKPSLNAAGVQVVDGAGNPVYTSRWHGRVEPGLIAILDIERSSELDLEIAHLSVAIYKYFYSPRILSCIIYETVIEDETQDLLEDAATVITQFPFVLTEANTLFWRILGTKLGRVTCQIVLGGLGPNVKKVSQITVYHNGFEHELRFDFAPITRPTT